MKSNLMRRILFTGLGIITTSLPVFVNVNSVYAATGGKTSSQAITWVKTKVGTGIDYDGYYGNQCVDLIKAYYAYLGNKPVLGNGADYSFNALPAGWKRYKNAQPKKGDILVYTGGYGGYGHVAIYESDFSTYHQNFNSHSYVERITYKYNGNWDIKYWGIIRPDFSVEKTSSGTSSKNTASTAPTTGLFKVNGTWRYYSNGKLNTSYVGLIKNAYGWWYVKNGRINYSYSGMAKSPKNGKWVYVNKGYVDYSYTGLAKSPKNGKWYYMKKGVLDTTYTGLAKSPKFNRLLYVKQGIFTTSFSGKVKYNGRLYTVKKGIAY